MVKTIAIAAVLGMSIPAVLHRLTDRIQNYWLRFMICAGFGLGLAISVPLVLTMLFPGFFGSG